eukprot:TRINITY_DN9704_c0_g1_i1.p1 TRINITY_DN9704_c0_g1~~TRINITY_DN9704_c0_g1_i1.p1  ORF type:complete len:426 (+),score=48.79 TRINITY_DN9704_c0_g1_i1:149-1279(+)
MCQGASLSTAESLIGEYKKFFFVMATQRPGQRATPSELVDQIWHLHMSSPRSYSRLCTAAGSRNFHHEPLTPLSTSAERLSCSSQYKATRSLINDVFRFHPEFWPPASVRFSGAASLSWRNTEPALAPVLPFQGTPVDLHSTRLRPQISSPSSSSLWAAFQRWHSELPPALVTRHAKEMAISPPEAKARLEEATKFLFLLALEPLNAPVLRPAHTVDRALRCLHAFSRSWETLVTISPGVVAHSPLCPSSDLDSAYKRTLTRYEAVFEMSVPPTVWPAAMKRAPRYVLEAHPTALLDQQGNQALTTSAVGGGVAIAAMSPLSFYDPSNSIHRGQKPDTSSGCGGCGGPISVTSGDSSSGDGGDGDSGDGCGGCGGD